MRKFLITLFLFTITFNQPCFAQNAGKNWLKTYKTELEEIENYLNNITFLSADFIQQSENGDISKGKLLLSRPGKMRIDYQTPEKLLIIVNDSVLSYTDIELDETSYLTTNSTPASFLTRQYFSFAAKDIEITNFSKNQDSLKVSILKKNKKTAGIFTLIFKTNPIKFSQMEVKNDLGEVTKVSFINSQFGEKIDDKLFVIRNKNLPE